MYTENDKLERTEFIDTLEKIIDKKFNDRDGFSFAIDGKWGCGKTFIVNMLEERLKNKYLVIKYNCWKYDYYEEPVMAIMSVIADALNKIAAENNPPRFVNKDTFKNIAKFLIGTGAKLFEAATNIDLKSILELGKEVINDEYKEAISKDFDSKDTLTKAIDIIHMALCLAHSDKRVLFIVDELDRCLPEYAIKVLERLHHVNEGTQFITMLSINKNELAGSIAKVFGKQGCDTDFADYYFQKFTNLIIPIPNGKPTNTLLDKFKLCKNIFNFYTNELFNDDFEKFLSDVLGALPIRSIDIIDKQINAINALIPLCGDKPTEIAFCVATLKVLEKNIVKGNIFMDIIGGNFFIQFKFTKGNPFNYNEIDFNKALSKWSETSCHHATNLNTFFDGFVNTMVKLQDNIKYFFHISKYRFEIKLNNLPSQDEAYIKDFSTWLNRINLLEE